MSTWLQKTTALYFIAILIRKENGHCWNVGILIACRISSSCWCGACSVLTLICKTLEAQVFSPSYPSLTPFDSLLEMSKQMERCRKSAFWVSVSFASVALHFCGSTAFLCCSMCPPDMCVAELQSHREGQKSTEQLLIHCMAFCNMLTCFALILRA